MRKTLSLSLAAMLTSSAAMAAMAATVDKFNITAQEHAACDGDAVSLCAWTYPDEDKLLICMRDNRERLSPLCSAAFTAGMKRRHLPL